LLHTKGMKNQGLKVLCYILVMVGGEGCAALPAIGPAVSLGVVGVHYLANSRVERVFFAPWPSVQEATMKALRQWELPVKEEGIGPGHAELQAAASDLTITLTLSALTPKTTKVSAKAGSGLARDRATAEAILAQIASNLDAASSSVVGPSASTDGNDHHRGSPTQARFQTPAGLQPSTLDRGNGQTPRLVPLVHPTPASEAAGGGPGSPPSLPVSELPPDCPQDPDEPADEMGYRQAVEAYVEGVVQEALEGFQRYVSRCPGADHCSRAYYLLGETYVLKQDYLQALLAFEMVIREYPHSPEVPRALYREVLIYRTLRQPRLAKAALKKLLISFPRSREARILRPRPTGG